MNIDLIWDNPTPHPSCGFKVEYRRKGDPYYSFLTTSGATSATTSVHITAQVPASYEGFVQSDCCTDNLSTIDPWGVNAYGLISITDPARSLTIVNVTISSPYPNSYDTLLSGTVTSNIQGDLSYTSTYPAGNTNILAVLSGVTPTGSNTETFTNLILSTISPIFNNGGSLQQFDPVKTPPYFEFTQTSGQTSGTTLWNGSPTVLPSFTLDSFTVTGTDGGGNPISGDLAVSWAQGVVFGGGVYPYNSITWNIYDSLGVTILGTMTTVTTIKGLRSAILSFVKGGNPISISTPYKLLLYWADGSSLLGIGTFYLPSF